MKIRKGRKDEEPRITGKLINDDSKSDIRKIIGDARIKSAQALFSN